MGSNKEILRLLYALLKLVLDERKLVYLDLDKKFKIFDDSTIDFGDHVHHLSSVNLMIASWLADFMMERGYAR